MNKIVIVLFILSLSLPSFGAFEFYKGARQLGMGGAGVAVANDETALMVNPNGLSRIRGYILTMVDPELTNSLEGAETVLGTAVINSASPSNVYDNLSNSVNKPYYFKGQLLPSFVTSNFGIGVLGKYELLAQRNADGTMDINYLNDYAVVSGFNIPFWGGRVKVGVNGKLINRVEYSGQRDPATESLELEPIATEGLALGYDVGLTLAAPWTWLPTLAAVARDVGGTRFDLSDGLFGGASNGTPQAITQTLDVGFAIFPILSNDVRSTWTVDYRDVLTMSDAEDAMDRLHIGNEFNMYDEYFLRFGYGSNAWTVGFEYATSVFQFQLATYAETVDFTRACARRG